MGDIRTNQQWLKELTAGGNMQETAIADLRNILLRAGLYIFQRNLDDFQGLSQKDILQQAEDCAQDSLMAVMSHLSDFRGDSKFTTWAYKFAINKALMIARHERWKGVSLDELSDSWDGNFPVGLLQGNPGEFDLEQTALKQELQTVIRKVIEKELSEKQRQVLILMVFQEVPMDEVALYMKSNRNAVYKLLHDARRKLKKALLTQGYDIDESLASIETGK